MNEYPLIIQPPAFDDLDEAYQWIRERAPEAAARWFDGFVAALDSLTTSPERCGLAPENDAVEPEIRQLRYGRRGGVKHQRLVPWKKRSDMRSGNRRCEA